MKLVDEKELAELQDFKIQALKGKALAPHLERIGAGFRGPATEYLMRRVNPDGSNAKEVVDELLAETPSMGTEYKEPAAERHPRMGAERLGAAIANHMKKVGGLQ